jgi:hypothetical protein
MAVSEWHPEWDCWTVIVDNVYVGDDDANPLYLKFPSHWMPLPNPPESNNSHAAFAAVTRRPQQRSD